MSDFDRPTSTLLQKPERTRRNGGSSLSGRLARTFGSLDRTREEPPEWEDGELEYDVAGETEAWDSPDALFPMTRHGYDPIAVDRRIDELERELSELHDQLRTQSDVRTEIERVGEQTSAILLTAHDEAQKIKREAQEQADRCLADAAAQAVKMTADAKRRLSDLDTETDAVWQERARLLEDARNVASGLLSVVEEATARFPGEPEKVAAPDPAAARPVAAKPVAAPDPVAVDPVAAGPAAEEPADELPDED